MSLDALEARIVAGEAVVAGVLSGTSGDGIDVALVRLPPRPATGPWPAPELAAFAIEPFPAELAARVRSVLDGRPSGLRETALLHRDLGLAFGDAVARVARRAGLRPDLVGSHGQTVWHHDGLEPSGPATLQLGDGDFVAERAGCTTVSDFRQRDVAAGGEGAPLSVLADGWLFASEPRPLAVLNLGGMANLSLLDDDGERGFDTGPCGSLLDGLARRLLDLPFDPDGSHAARGTARPALVEAILDHPYFARPAPKSTGRDTFGGEWVDAVLGRAEALGVDEPGDVLASAVEAVAAHVAAGFDAGFRPEARPARLLVAGGGARNRTLALALASRLACPVESSVVAGVDPDGREAMVFALLAVRCVLGLASTRAGATGAAPGRPLGKISPISAREGR